MKFSSPIISAGSGSLAGITASRNRGGNYFRARAIPTNPNSQQQQTVRSNMADMVAYWTTTLTQAQRDAWATYAANVPVIDKLGAPIFLTGQNMFVRSNLGGISGGATVVEDAPTVFNLGGFTAPSIASASAGGADLDLNFENTDEWANEDDARMVVYISRQQNPGINYFKGPYRVAGVILGDATTPPTSPATITLPFAVAQGNRLFVKVNVVRADGRYSTPWRGTVIAGA